MDKNFPFIQRLAYALLIVIMTYLILKTAKQLLYPLALAMLFSYILLPIVIFLEKKFRFPSSLAAITAVLMGLFVFITAIYLFTNQIKLFIADLPTVKEEALTKIKILLSKISNFIGFSMFVDKDFLFNYLKDLTANLDVLFSKLLVDISKTIEGILFIPIFTFFLLLFRKRWRNFILRLSNVKENKITLHILEQITKVTIRYMMGVFTVVLILAISHSIFFSLIKLKYPIALGIITATVSFLPYFGTLVSTIIPFTFSLILGTEHYQPISILIYFWIITFIDHNILTPTITGGNVNLNPLVTIFGLIVAWWIWGIPGMIIVVPAIAVIKIICDNVEGLQPYGYLLGMDQHGLIETLKKLFHKLKNAVSSAK